MLDQTGQINHGTIFLLTLWLSQTDILAGKIFTSPFFLESYLSYSKKLISIKKKYPWPLGVPGGAIKGSDPQNGKILFRATFLEKKKFLSLLRSFGTLIQSPIAQKKLGVDSFLVHFWTKNCKKNPADFHVAKKIHLTVNFLFHCKNQLFRPFL